MYVSRKLQGERVKCKIDYDFYVSDHLLLDLYIIRLYTDVFGFRAVCASRELQYAGENVNRLPAY